MSEQAFYVTGIAMSQFVLGAERLGIDAKHYMTCAGLDPEVHLNPLAKVPSAPYEEALLHMILDSGDELLGFHIGEQVMLPLYGSIVTVALSASSLLDAIKSAITFQSLVSGNVGGLSVIERGDTVTLNLSMAHQNPIVRRHIMECVITLLGTIFRFISGQPDLVAEAVHFEHQPPSPQARRT
ncbi:MAG: AraC family transcriptional regulator ligand-binding domain-containing protein [Alcanivoracaceae bacterium]